MSLESLTALNIRLIAQSTETQTSVAEEEANTENDITEAAGDEAPPDPDEEGEEDEEEVRGRFSTEMPFEYNRVKEWIEAAIELPSGMSTLVGDFVDEWAQRLAGEPIRDAEGNIVDFKFPSANDIINNIDFQTGATYLPMRAQWDQLPPVFLTTGEDEQGNPIMVTVVNDPLTGPVFAETYRPDEEPIREEVPSGNFRVIRSPFDNSSRIVRTPSEGGAAGAEIEPEVTPVSGGAATPSEARGTVLTREEPDTSTVQTPSEARGVPLGPVIPPDVLSSVLTPPSSGSGRGRGGGGGGTTRTIEFDRDHLLAQVRDRYNEVMLAPDSAPMGLVGSIVDEYMREAKAFWINKGVQKDFDTFVWEKLRAMPRYKQIYRHKIPAQTEAAFIQSFMAPIGGFGMSPEFTRRQTEIAVQTGVGPAAQAERVSRTREVQGQGGFSQQLANTLAGLGIRS